MNAKELQAEAAMLREEAHCNMYSEHSVSPHFLVRVLRLIEAIAKEIEGNNED